MFWFTVNLSSLINSLLIVGYLTSTNDNISCNHSESNIPMWTNEQGIRQVGWPVLTATDKKYEYLDRDNIFAFETTPLHMFVLEIYKSVV